VKDDDVIGVRRVVVLAKRGVPRHRSEHIARHRDNHGDIGTGLKERDGEKISLRNIEPDLHRRIMPGLTEENIR
jgi:hypothetical protein